MFAVWLLEVLLPELSGLASLSRSVSVVTSMALTLSIGIVSGLTLFSFSTLGTLYVAIVAILDGLKPCNGRKIGANGLRTVQL